MPYERNVKGFAFHPGLVEGVASQMGPRLKVVGNSEAGCAQPASRTFRICRACRAHIHRVMSRGPGTSYFRLASGSYTPPAELLRGEIAV